MLFYVLHEFLKLFEEERLHQVQREWFQTVDEVLHACTSEIRHGEKRNSEENGNECSSSNRMNAFHCHLSLVLWHCVIACVQTLARWKELTWYPTKIKAWKSVVTRECKPRRAPVLLPRSETERLVVAPDQLRSFKLPPPSTLQLQLDRSNCLFVFEQSNFASKSEEKQHWCDTAIAFIDICRGVST